MSLCRLDVGGDEDWPTVRLHGEVDLSNAAALAERAERAVSNRASGLLLDLSGLTYLDSAGLAMLFRLARRLGDRQQVLRLVVPPTSRVRRLLVLAGVGAAAQVVDGVPEPAPPGAGGATEGPA